VADLLDSGGRPGAGTSAGVSDGSRTQVGGQLSEGPAPVEMVLGAATLVPGGWGLAAGGLLAGYYVYQGEYGKAAIAAGMAVLSVGGGALVIKGAKAAAGAIGKLGRGANGIGQVGKLSIRVQKAIRSTAKELEAHRAKLEAYRRNPFAFDNQGHLARNAGRPEIQKRIIDGRIRHLEREIANFETRIERLLQGEIEP
jgi:hypothetical protein